MSFLSMKRNVEKIVSVCDIPSYLILDELNERDLKK